MKETKKEKKVNDHVNGGCATILGVVLSVLICMGLFKQGGALWWHYILAIVGISALMLLFAKCRLFFIDGIDNDNYPLVR